MPEFIAPLKPLLCQRGHPRIQGEKQCYRCKRALATKRHQEDPRRHMLQNARQSAKRLGLPFNIEIEYLEIPVVCPALGITLRASTGYRTDSSPSVDRIIPHLGYVKGNVQVLSMRANRIKNDATVEELKKLYDFMQRTTCQNL